MRRKSPVRVRALVVMTAVLGCCCAMAEPDCGVVSSQSNRAAVGAEPISPRGTKKLVFFRARFPDDEVDPISLEEAEQTLKEVNATFTRVSYGKFSLVWQIPPVLQLTKTRDQYNGSDGFARFLDDVRQAGLAAGVDYRDFDLDIVRHSGVPEFRGGYANMGFRGAQVQAPGAPIIVHELGHNLGLSHANLWETGGPGLSAGSPPLPSNYPSLPSPKSIPMYPDSALGHQSVTGPGYSAEYGDMSDIMGSGTLEYSAIFRYQLGWLEPSQIAEGCDTARIVRIQALDGQNSPELPRAIRAGGPFHSPAGERQYWVQLPPMDSNAVEAAGIELRWADAYAGADSLLLAAGRTGAEPNAGTLLPVGQTFSDGLAQLHITVVDAGGTGLTRWADVALFHGRNTANQQPTVSLTASSVTVAVDQVIAFSAVANDPDGDALSWRWDFGDGSSSNKAGNESKSWRRLGDYLVMVEVSDRKGGVTSASVAVRVGNASTRRVSGRVLDATGQPVAGVRVHNGVFDPTGNSGRRYVSTFTDASGRYTLTGLESGTYTNGAYLVGYTTLRRPPVTLGDTDLDGVDFTVTALPTVSVTAVATTIPESAGLTNLFLFTRTGPTNDSLTVRYELGGSATGGSDYVRPFLNSVVIPAGSHSAAVPFNLIDDAKLETDESVIVQLVYPTNASRQDAAGNSFTVYFPGYELAEIDGQLNWVLTDPSYFPGEVPSATVVIQDDDGVQQSLTASLLANGSLRLMLKGQLGSTLVLETRTGMQSWSPIQTNLLQNADTAITDLPVTPLSHALYRTVAY